MNRLFVNVKEIVEQYLRTNGFDGLYSELGECGCGIGDLMPCDSPCDICEPAFKRYCPCCGEDIYVSARSVFELCRKADEKNSKTLSDFFGIFADDNTETATDEPGE